MKMDILAILMVAFALFAILMFILFFVYAKKYHNEKKISEDYNDLDDEESSDNDEMLDVKKEIELIDIMINDKNYVFDANNYHLNNNQDVLVSINGIDYRGIVTKSNYKADLDDFIQIPTKLELNENVEIFDKKTEEVENTQESSNDMEEFVPIKKNS